MWFISSYLCVVFSLFALYKSVILAEHHIAIASQGFALLIDSLLWIHRAVQGLRRSAN
jgi:hypothetical protein